MPVFEEGEPITSEEFKRQQAETNRKAFNRNSEKFMESVDSLGEFKGGDEWEEQAD